MKFIGSLALITAVFLSGCQQDEPPAAKPQPKEDVQQFVPKQEMQFKR